MVWVMLRATTSAPLPWPDWANTTESGSSWRVERRRRKKSASAWRCLRMRLRARPASPAMMASAIMEWACLVSVGRLRCPRRCQSGEYNCATRLKTSTKSSSPGLPLIDATRAWNSRGSPPGSTGLSSAKRRSSARSFSSVRSDASWQAISSRMMRASKISSRRGIDPVQVQHHGVDDRADGRLGDDQAAAGTAARSGRPAGAPPGAPPRGTRPGSPGSAPGDRSRTRAPHRPASRAP